ncbi:MAG: hypothetical protein K0R18_663 [Bacillales bacterium]|jgi:hypothetical protein|nr:hypothetical protein [Bacillales bacterium]
MFFARLYNKEPNQYNKNRFIQITTHSSINFFTHNLSGSDTAISMNHGTYRRGLL